MDNTSYMNDIEESLLAYLENKGILSRDSIDPSLKIKPFKDFINSTFQYRESLFSYYNRLYDFDQIAGYTFSAQVFAGIPLHRLKGHVDELMRLDGPIPATQFENGVLVNTAVPPPKVFRGMVELWNKLRANGIDVYVMSASAEELVRMIASDPVNYGYNLKPENVIGVSLLMNNLTSGELTTSRKQIADGNYNQTRNLGLVMTTSLWTPATWQFGKVAGIQTYIHPWKRPILVAGDTPKSDGPMLFHATDVERGGVRLWINRKKRSMTELKDMMRKNSAEQARLGLPVTAGLRWVFVKPEEIL
ncbi:hypothetical protein RJ55_04891 [Drechmeria coniospora]|nr:hypothetical protein RJ55_04891 [Drechmeria coniospora]